MASNWPAAEARSFDLDCHGRLARARAGRSSVPKWRPRRYNEVIGYIRLHFFGSQIRGDYFGVIADRIVRTRRKTFKYRTHKLAPEINIPPGAANSEIAELVKQYVNDCRKELPGGNRRYVDTELLDALAPHIDWRAVSSNGLPFHCGDLQDVGGGT